eukprot:SAG11_NODE_21501_length_424_cov_0.636923_1_plen_54_part_10
MLFGDCKVGSTLAALPRVMLGNKLERLTKDLPESGLLIGPLDGASNANAMRWDQ